MTHFFTSPACLDHLVAPGHPERPERLAFLLSELQSSSMWAELSHHDASEADLGVIARVHDHTLLAELENAVPERDIVAFSADNHMSPGTLGAARRAVGAVLDALEVVFNDDDRRAFCAVRPPGHHAEEDAAMGFCFYNSIAVGADAALQRDDVERVAILDFDVHHGNGTVNLFRDRPEVLVCSSFQHPHYPNRLHDVPGEHLVYSPLRAGTSSDTFRQTIERDWLDAISRHDPDLILVSAGFDAHAADPLADINLDEDDYSWITELIISKADDHANGRIVSMLEGGYDLRALARSVAAHLEALAA